MDVETISRTMAEGWTARGDEGGLRPGIREDDPAIRSLTDSVAAGIVLAAAAGMAVPAFGVVPEPGAVPEGRGEFSFSEDPLSGTRSLRVSGLEPGKRLLAAGAFATADGAHLVSMAAEADADGGITIGQDLLHPAASWTGITAGFIALLEA